MFNARKRKAEPKEKPAWQRALDDDDDVPPPPRAAEPPAVEVPAAVPSSSELLDEDEDDDDDDKDLSAYAFGEEEEEEEDKAARALARNSVQPSCRVRVTNLSHDTRDDQLLELFTGTRPPRTVEMLPPSAASITFETREEAVAAVSLTGIELAGSKLTVLMEHEPAPQALAAGEGYGGPRAAGYQEQLATYGYKLGGRGSRTGTPKVFFCDDDARSREKQQRREGKRNAVGGKGRGRPQIGQAGASVGPF
mmetsp:Transcript_8582/g.28261  ORF Transcript_8582/g.28261 Transcript_8582/m.28261 type:complete len:251 (-) Transcript_8582:230-982(-)